jgi:hypothetical protein
MYGNMLKLLTMYSSMYTNKKILKAVNPPKLPNILAQQQERTGRFFPTVILWLLALPRFAREFQTAYSYPRKRSTFKIESTV